MASIFEIIREEFIGELDAIRLLVTTFDGQGKPPKARAAAANSSTLLVAATFEEFIRQCAREYARIVVSRSKNREDLPIKLAATAWRRSMESLARVRIDVDKSSRDTLLLAVKSRFAVVHAFINGDLSQNIYDDLIHNENNMRSNELNSMFKVAGLKDVCTALSRQEPLLTFFQEVEPSVAHGKFVTALEDLMERRNNIAHALNPGSFSGSDQILKDLDMLSAVAKSLCLTLCNQGHVAALDQDRS